MSGRKPRKISQETYAVDGDGGRILSILGGEIMRFRLDSVEFAKIGMEKIPEKDWPCDLGSLFYIWEIWWVGRAEVTQKVYRDENFQ